MRCAYERKKVDTALGEETHPQQWNSIERRIYANVET
jgi:hypothetical protein